jgi:hypothetical protein
MEVQENRVLDHKQLLISTLGHNGTMLLGSKSAYKEKYPDDIIIFNANVITSQGKVWYGDINYTKDKSKLEQLASILKENVMILKESDARFENENLGFVAWKNKAYITINYLDETNQLKLDL